MLFFEGWNGWITLRFPIKSCFYASTHIKKKEKYIKTTKVIYS